MEACGSNLTHKSDGNFKGLATTQEKYIYIYIFR